MMTNGQVQIVAFYEFKDMSSLGDLGILKQRLKELFQQSGVRGTLILAPEGFNGMVCGEPAQVKAFVSNAHQILASSFSIKKSFHDQAPFRKIDVKVKPEIVTLKRDVDI